jgi:magnesium-transporting ATPase (P-type)
MAFLEGDPKFAVMIAKHVKVFGRCNPSEKVAVVSHFVERGYKTLMCGDGSNDCGSLKAAHVGIALSSSEASVVAPFTSLDKTITSVAEVLREGRCALASAFAAYSYYIIYGQVESLLQTINAYFAITFTEWCWVFLDGVWSIIMAFTLPLAKAAKTLSPNRPTASLLGPRTMFSVCGMLAWNFLFLVIALIVLFHEDWFQCRKWNSDDVSNVRTIGDNYETTVLFLVGGYQYIASAIALNFGYTWREAWIRNYVFVFFALLFTVFQIVATLYPSAFSCIWRVNCDNEVSMCS